MKYFTILILLSFLIENPINSQNYIWAKSFGGLYSEFGSSIITDIDGNAYITGSFSSPILVIDKDTFVNKGVHDLFIVKFSKNGSVLWAKSFGGNMHDEGTSINIDSYGNLVICGIFKSPSIVFGTKVLINKGYEDIFVIKMNNKGDLVWANSIGGNYSDKGKNITTDRFGNVYVSATYKSTVLNIETDTFYNKGFDDICVIKYNSNGSFLWAKNLGGNYIDYVNCITTDSENNFIIIGSFDSDTFTINADTLLNVRGNLNKESDIYLLKLDENGNTIFIKSYGGSESDGGLSVCCDLKNNIYITGYFQSSFIYFDTIPLFNNKNLLPDGYIIKLNLEGNIVWAKSFGGNGSDKGSQLISDYQNNIILLGRSTSSTLIIDSFSLYQYNGVAFFLAKYNENGNIKWIENDGGSWYTLYSVFTLDCNNNLYITGCFNSSCVTFGLTTLINVTNNSDYHSDLFIAKYSFESNFNDFDNKRVYVYPNPTNTGFFHAEFFFKSDENVEEINIYNLEGSMIFKQTFNFFTEYIIPNQTKGVYLFLVKTNKNIYSQKIVII